MHSPCALNFKHLRAIDRPRDQALSFGQASMEATMFGNRGASGNYDPSNRGRFNTSTNHADEFERKYTGWTEEQLQAAYER